MQNKFLARILTAVAITIAFTACAIPGKYRPTASISSDCSKGSVVVDIKYSDSYLKVTPRANLKRDAGVKFVLKTKKGRSIGKTGTKDNRDLIVTIKGERFDPSGGGGGDTAVSWLNKTGTAGPKRRNELIVCAADDQAYGTYFYSVEVENVGILDPRADVEQ